ncbi:MAG: arsenate reductase/protein-tyrosine-phosphatase family protein [Actinomycetota bacterium]
MTSILVVCTGNICRSPIAEGLLRDALQRRFERAPRVSSAGTSGLEGSSAEPRSVQAAAELGIDIGGHVARRLTAAMVDGSDLLLCMASEHRDSFDAASDRAFTLKELVRSLETLPAPAPDAGPQSMSERIAAANLARRRGAVPASRDDDVADPLGQPLEAYRAIAWEIGTWTERLVNGMFGTVAEVDAAEGS